MKYNIQKMVQTRSQTKKLLEESKKKIGKRVLPNTIIQPNLPKKKGPQYKVNIDFDEASLSWRVNKIRLENGEYQYTQW